ncbi:hypothetical protein DUNSADRAFT_248 [Dunaliella salina]|uniref:Dolichol phosphate-mannose biosynthesis regulatory protein n=1 Tax=Dunaliella salina TaxID=3046 RepID=A0ABQ7FZB9_DUNSA|nr:hypothetical protein DUNSADRAFT_248 [Dunaliella salina]|eukprot:KAF5827692.1 hypothetical protein DUNSADRAFT_248 [Dunaliella salina]
MQESLKGRLFLAVLCTGFVYYTCWLILPPFIEEGQGILKLFPPIEYALLLPVWLLVTVVCTLAGYVGYLVMRHT